MSIASDIAKAALIEAGRPDLAANVRANAIGAPSSLHSGADIPVVRRAFLLGHLAAGHHARMDGDGILCDECWDAKIAFAEANP